MEQRNDIGLVRAFIEDDHERVLRVMTFNIRHGKGMDDEVDLERIIEEIIQSGAVVIGLQEVDRYNPRSGFKDQIKLIGEALGMYWVYSPSINLGWTQYGNAILSKYPIAASQVTVLPGEPELRTVIQADILVEQELMRVVNTHLGVSTKDRERQMPILMEMLDEDSIPTIVIGDFNMEIGHSLMTGMKNKWNKAEAGKPTLVSGQEIDHVFYNIHVNSLSAWTQPTNASDHYPVIVEFRRALHPALYY